MKYSPQRNPIPHQDYTVKPLRNDPYRTISSQLCTTLYVLTTSRKIRRFIFVKQENSQPSRQRISEAFAMGKARIQTRLVLRLDAAPRSARYRKTTTRNSSHSSFHFVPEYNHTKHPPLRPDTRKKESIEPPITAYHTVHPTAPAAGIAAHLIPLSPHAVSTRPPAPKRRRLAFFFSPRLVCGTPSPSPSQRASTSGLY